MTRETVREPHRTVRETSRQEVPCVRAAPAVLHGRLIIVSEQAQHVFVYGTLRPGDVRWKLLEPFVVDEGWADTISGRLFDTGLDYPAAILDNRAEPGGIITGRTYTLLSASVDRCLQILDAEEDSVGGNYRRVLTTTDRGAAAWAYEYGDGLDLMPIESGNWFDR
jgi:gamma-glutamylcyclotransferase (GGCT)/AIG2-like uncharacterized protein YtfP